MRCQCLPSLVSLLLLLHLYYNIAPRLSSLQHLCRLPLYFRHVLRIIRPLCHGLLWDASFPRSLQTCRWPLPLSLFPLGPSEESDPWISFRPDFGVLLASASGCEGAPSKRQPVNLLEICPSCLITSLLLFFANVAWFLHYTAVSPISPTTSASSSIDRIAKAIRYGSLFINPVSSSIIHVPHILPLFCTKVVSSVDCSMRPWKSKQSQFVQT